MIKQRELLERKEWDVLIVLDCCRYDAFMQVIDSYSSINGTCLKVDSEALNTKQWYEYHWQPKAVHNDITIITAHPSIYRYVHKYHKFFGDWNIIKLKEHSDTNWMHPNLTMKPFIDQQKIDRKYLVHLIPPHLPYIGNEGKNFLEKFEWPHDSRHLTHSIYDIVTKYGCEYGWEELWEYYIENLKISLNSIFYYIPFIKGRIILTADHGEIIGPKLYGHGKDGYSELKYVPWFEVKR